MVCAWLIKLIFDACESLLSLQAFLTTGYATADQIAQTRHCSVPAPELFELTLSQVEAQRRSSPLRQSPKAPHMHMQIHANLCADSTPQILSCVRSRRTDGDDNILERQMIDSLNIVVGFFSTRYKLLSDERGTFWTV